MKNMILVRFAALLLLLGFPVFASATAIVPKYDDFGSHPEITFVPFGGPYSGIPNNNVAYSSVGGANFALSATARYGNQVVQTDDMGNFYALAGGDTLNDKPSYAKWNIDVYVSNLLAGQSWKLFYGLNPLLSSTSVFGAAADYQDSWNLGMAFLGTGFDPNAIGAYGFNLVIYGAPTGLEAATAIGNTAINVFSGDGIAPPKGGGSAVPDTTDTLMLLGIGMFGLAALSRKIQSKSFTPGLAPVTN